jgi:nucleoside-diphosphate-sugar epimerase
MVVPILKKRKKALVCGAGGFIVSHLVKRLIIFSEITLKTI